MREDGERVTPNGVDEAKTVRGAACGLLAMLATSIELKPSKNVGS